MHTFVNYKVYLGKGYKNSIYLEVFLQQLLLVIIFNQKIKFPSVRLKTQLVKKEGASLPKFIVIVTTKVIVTSLGKEHKK